MKLPAATAVLINAVFTNAIYYKPLLLGILALIGTVASLIGVIIKYNLDPDKLHKPWRSFCADQPLFDNLAAAKVPPVDIFVGVMTVDSKFDRRRVIRETYGTLTTPRDEITGLRFGNVQLKFVLGRPRKEYAHEIAMEMELYNDIVVLDMPDTSKSTKTLNFMRWAAVNATVPVVHSSSPGTIRWKLADYVLKADDDTFIFLDELERRLRMAPRTMAYWGYPVISESRTKPNFMAGELYGLSHDLVKFVAESPDVAQMSTGKEDVRTAQWLELHPQTKSINWIYERCWIYDNPKAGTPYSHGFLFPDEVKRIKDEVARGIPKEVINERGGPWHANGWSTVTTWRVLFNPPRKDLSAEEQIESLVEGGGRWGGTWVRLPSDPDTPKGDIVVYQADDKVLPPSFTFHPEHGLRVYPDTATSGASSSAAVGRAQDSFFKELRNRRTFNERYGGTVVVHFNKKNVWFYETALALIGRNRAWRHGIGGAGSEWRTPGSPLVASQTDKHPYIIAGH